MNIESGTVYRLVGLPHQGYEPGVRFRLDSTTNDGGVNTLLMYETGGETFMTWRLADLEAAIRLGVLVWESTPLRWIDHPGGEQHEWSEAQLSDGRTAIVELLHPSDRGWRWMIRHALVDQLDRALGLRGFSEHDIAISGMGIAETAEAAKQAAVDFIGS
jgi:hypothetical protein